MDRRTISLYTSACSASAGHVVAGSTGFGVGRFPDQEIDRSRNERKGDTDFEFQIESSTLSQLYDLKPMVRVVEMTSIHPQEAVLKRTLSKFFSDESGATAIEYGLIAAGISLAIIAVVNGLGTNLNDKFTSINTSLK